MNAPDSPQSPAGGSSARRRRMLQEATTGTFTTLLGYEWHSSVFGGYCMIFDR